MTTASLPSLAMILSMSLVELRERVDLAERMTIAARHAPEGIYTAIVAAVQPSADLAKPKASKATAKAAVASNEVSDVGVVHPTDFEGGSMIGTADAFDFGGAEESAEDIFNMGEPSPPAPAVNYRKMCEDHLTAIKTAQDTERAKAVMALLGKGKFARLADVPEEAIEALWTHLQKI